MNWKRIAADYLPMMIIWGLIVFFFSLQSDHFLTAATFRTLAGSIPPLVVVACGMTFVLIIAGIDLSVGSVLGFSAAVLAMGIGVWEWPVWLAVIACLLAGSAMGFLNGSVSVWLGVPSFIVTLGTLEIARGLSYLTTNSATQSLSGQLDFLYDPIGGLGVSLSFVIAVLVVLICQFILSKTVFGRHLIAIGTNENAVQLAGIPTRGKKILVFCLCGFFSALASIFWTARLGSADPNAGGGFELLAIAAVVIGGTSLMGGKGSIINSFVGVLIIATLDHGLASMGADEPVKRIITGAVIVLAVTIDALRGNVFSRLRGKLQFRKVSVLLPPFLFLGMGVSHAQRVEKETHGRLNFLVIAIDDLNDYVGCLGGHPNALTPNIDRLAKRGVLFTNAHCNSPVCNPSRASIWTGLRPSTTGITSNPSGWFRDQAGFEQVATLSQHMGQSGYATQAWGKLYHLGKGNATLGEWQRFHKYGYGPVLPNERHLNFDTGDRLTDWGVRNGIKNEAASFDPEIADRTIAAFEDTWSQPFFVGCGFFRPHTPLYAHQRWFDLHPLDKINRPETRPDDTADLVYFGKRPRREEDIEAPGLFQHDWIVENDQWESILQAYFASTSSMDFELGRVLDALEQKKRDKDTMVILFSDHGWSLGEKEHWGKAALWEQVTQVPFIIAGPGIPEGVRCDQPVELLSIYPTVMDYAGLKAPHQLEGHSLRPLLEQADADWPHPVVTTFVDHHALRTDRWRYIRYATGEEELYDHTNDPDEFNNLAVTQPTASESELNRLRSVLETTLRKK